MSDQKPKGRFNPETYEMVKARKKRFYEKYEDGRIISECIRADQNSALFKATLYKSGDDQQKGVPVATGYAQEFKGQGGFANEYSWTENCEESAIGRALDNAGFSGDLRCSREEIIKVQVAAQSQPPAPKPKPIIRPVQQPIPAPFNDTENDQLESYIVKTGKKYKGMALGDIEPYELQSYCKWLRDEFKNQGKSPQGDQLEFLTAAEAYLESKRPHNQPPRFDQDEEIPF